MMVADTYGHIFNSTSKMHSANRIKKRLTLSNFAENHTQVHRLSMRIWWITLVLCWFFALLFTDVVKNLRNLPATVSRDVFYRQMKKTN